MWSRDTISETAEDRSPKASSLEGFVGQVDERDASSKFVKSMLIEQSLSGVCGNKGHHESSSSTTVKAR